MNHADFVREYAASIDRMMETHGQSRLDLADDFMEAWRFLNEMKADDFAKVKIGLNWHGASGANPKPAQTDPKFKYGAHSRNMHISMDVARFNLAKKYGAVDVGTLSEGWEE